MTGQGEKIEERLGWLDLARSQSTALAQARAEHPVPFCWEAASKGAVGHPWLRQGWIAAALALTVVAVAAATLAYVHGRPGTSAKSDVRGSTARRQTSGPPRVTPAGQSLSAAKKAEPAVQPATDPSPGKTVRGAHSPGAKQRPPRRNATQGSKSAAVQNQGKGGAAPGGQEPGKDPDRVMFDEPGGDGGGELIIVTPPRKLEPLWTPEAFKKRGRKSSGL